MIQLILHILGDFVLQNDYMAGNKLTDGRKGLIACITHCAVYSLPFFLISNGWQVVLIFTTHLIVDRFKLARMWCNFFKVGVRIPPDVWIKAYLLFMVDMTIHLICNYLILSL